MLFDSPAYFIFLIPVVLLYWRLNRGEQNVFLLLELLLRLVGIGASWRSCIGSTTIDFLIAQKNHA